MIPKGTKVYCPNCRSYLGSFVREIPDSEEVGLEDLRFGWRAGRKAMAESPWDDRCPFCGERFLFTIPIRDRRAAFFYDGEKWYVHLATPLEALPEDVRWTAGLLVTYVVKKTIEKYGFGITGTGPNCTILVEDVKRSRGEEA